MNFNATIIGQIIVFAIFVILCAKFVWPPIMAAMQERQKKIADGLNAASRAAKDLELAQHDAADKMREAKASAAEVVEQASRRAAILLDESKADAQAEAKRIIEAAQLEIKQERDALKAQLRAQVAGLAVEGAKKILQAEIDEKKHSELLDKLAAEL